MEENSERWKGVLIQKGMFLLSTSAILGICNLLKEENLTNLSTLFSFGIRAYKIDPSKPVNLRTLEDLSKITHYLEVTVTALREKNHILKEISSKIDYIKHQKSISLEKISTLKSHSTQVDKPKGLEEKLETLQEKLREYRQLLEETKGIVLS